MREAGAGAYCIWAVRVGRGGAAWETWEWEMWGWAVAVLRWAWYSCPPPTSHSSGEPSQS